MNISPSTRLCYRLMSVNDDPLLLEVDSDTRVMKYTNKGITQNTLIAVALSAV